MADFSDFHQRLIPWFADHHQDAPWRRDRDPYRIWISEIMLQQTQVATVIPYFERFMARFPNIHALADASPDDVLKLWEGLGYYSRARNLHQAARTIVKDLTGQFPRTVQGLLRLPGIGRYTAGAIASLAFAEDAPVLDGNVIRVLTRWLNNDQDITLDATRRSLWALAEAMIPAGKAGAWNEALMELGQRVCVPKNPRCEMCPVADLCQAKLAGRQTELPMRRARKELPHHTVAAGVIIDASDRILIAKRRPQDMLGGLWEFPGGKLKAGETLPECLAREIREELGIEVEVGRQIAMVRHAYTHFRITLYAFLCQYTGGEPQAIGCAEWTWTTLNDLDRFAFPRTNHKIIAALKNGGQSALAM